MIVSVILCTLSWITAGILLHKDVKRNGTQMRKPWFEKLADGLLSCSGVTKLFSLQVKQYVRQLCPTKEIQEACRQYYREKWIFILKIWFVGIHLVAVLSVSEQAESVLKEGNILQRGNFGEEKQTITLEVKKAGQSEDRGVEIPYDVSARTYTPEKIQEFTNRFLTEYEMLICGENTSLQEVKTNLILRESYEGYPMDFSWESSDYSILDDDGTIYQEELKEPVLVTLKMEITYGEAVCENCVTVRICPKEETEEEKWKKEILTAVQNADSAQKYTDTLRLPEQIEGKDVSYNIPQETSAGYFLFLLFLIVPLMYFAKDKDLKKATEEKKKRLSLKYPEFVSKFQLLLGAGMTVRNIVRKLSEDSSLGEDLRKELELLARDMKNGLSDKDALDRFGKRTNHPRYMKFAALLTQNLKKGTGDLMQQISEEAGEAFVLRKTHAKQLGEEAGTKLLAPMILMLAIVMAVLMIPAFLSFQI